MSKNIDFQKLITNRAKHIFKTEKLDIITTLSCDNKKCSNMIYVFVTAMHPFINLKCPKCGTLNCKRVFSVNFIDQGIFNLAKDEIMQEYSVGQSTSQTVSPEIMEKINNHIKEYKPGEVDLSSEIPEETEFTPTV